MHRAADAGDRYVPLPEPVEHRRPRGARSSAPARNLRLILDLFNLMNANTALVRVNNITSPTFNTLAQNLSPRIARVGVVVGF